MLAFATAIASKVGGRVADSALGGGQKQGFEPEKFEQGGVNQYPAFQPSQIPSAPGQMPLSTDPILQAYLQRFA